MDISFEQKVREKAYEIWVAAGMEDGMAHAHWVSAEQAVMNETQEPVAKKVAGSKKPAKAAAPKAAAKKPAAKAVRSSKTAKNVTH